MKGHGSCCSVAGKLVAVSLGKGCCSIGGYLLSIWKDGGGDVSDGSFYWCAGWLTALLVVGLVLIFPFGCKQGFQAFVLGNGKRRSKRFKKTRKKGREQSEALVARRTNVDKVVSKEN